MLAVRILICLEVLKTEEAQVVEHMNHAIDQLVIVGLSVLDSSMECEPMSLGTKPESPSQT